MLIRSFFPILARGLFPNLLEKALSSEKEIHYFWNIYNGPSRHNCIKFSIGLQRIMSLISGIKLGGDKGEIVALGTKFRPKWDPGRSGSLPKKKKKKNFFFFFFFFRETHFHSLTTQMQAVVTLSNNLLPMHRVSPSIKWQ